MIKSSLSDNSDAYLKFKKNITVANTAASGVATYNNN